LVCLLLPRASVWNDTLLQTDGAAPATWTTPVQFSLGTPRGKGGLAFGDINQESILPTSGSREQLTVLCVDADGDIITTASADSCKFAKQLKPGYLLVINASTAPGISSRLPVTRVITSIVSDVELTVDADFSQDEYLVRTTAAGLPHSGAAGAAGFVIAAEGDWTFVACPPRVGKRANGAGTIESSWNQGSWSVPAPLLDNETIAAGDGDWATAGGGATGSKHRIVGRGTRFATQFGLPATWDRFGSGGYYGQGPYLTVQARRRMLHRPACVCAS
jgi:hypothetical protein